ncbi:MAG: hypothetical protein WC712_10595 [Candidatus Brocadiia bacterium]
MHLLKQMRYQAMVIVVFILAAAFTTQIVLGSPIWAFVALTVLVLYFSRVFFPMKFRLDDEGIEVETFFGSRTRKWSEFRRASFFRHGVNLMTRARASRFEFFRSMDVYFPAEPTEAIAFIKAKFLEHSISDERDPS